MQAIKSISSSVAGRAAIVAGSAFVADGVLQVLDSQKNAGSRVVGLAGNLNLAFLAVALIAMAPSLIVLARYGHSAVAEKAGLAAAAGACLLAAGSLTSIVNQHDLAIFPAIAGLANVAWLGGLAVLGASLKRARRLPAVIAVGLPVMWIFSIPLATVGGCLVSGAYFLIVGYLLVNEAIVRRASSVAAPVRV